MNNHEIKTLWKFAKKIWIYSTFFWLLETITFLIIEGWHWKATHPIEIYCDTIVSNIWSVALFVTFYAGAELLINLRHNE